MKYAIVEIAGRQYKIGPDNVLKVDFLGDIKSFNCSKVLLLANSEFKVGYPYLDEKLVFDVLANIKEHKIRVATYKAKANTRRVLHARRIVSEIKLHLT